MMQVLKADKREGKGRQQWSPYEDNGGSCAAVAGPGFAVVGADTRQSSGYAVCARDFCKVQQIVLPTTTTTTTAGGSVSSSSAVLAAAGMQADVAELRRTLRADAVAYAHAHGGRHMSTPALAQHLGNTLYRRRFFPYYAFCVLAGVVSDEDSGTTAGTAGSRGVCYSYDAVGSFEEVSAAACGSAQTLVQAFLDSQLSAFSSHNALSQQKQKQLTVAEAKGLVREALTSAAERDIHTGDFLDIVVVSAAEGVSQERLPLKFD